MSNAELRSVRRLADNRVQELRQAARVDTWSSFTMEMMMMKLWSDGLVCVLRGTGNQMRNDLTDNEAVGEIAERTQRQSQCR